MGQPTVVKNMTSVARRGCRWAMEELADYLNIDGFTGEYTGEFKPGTPISDGQGYVAELSNGEYTVPVRLYRVRREVYLAVPEDLVHDGDFRFPDSERRMWSMDGHGELYRDDL